MNVVPAKKRWWNVEKNTAPVFTARVTDWTGVALTQASLSASGNSYTIYRLTDPHNEDTESAITSHSAVTLTVASVIYDALRLDAWWKDQEGNYIDTTGYNLAVQPSKVTAEPFAVAGASYKLVVTLNPTSGEDIVVRWFARCS